ncbi:MAG: rhomboid family intramembrane serine protease [Planctomycetota bacterium]
MRLIGELKDAELARKFAAYLMTEGITPQVDEENGIWEVWVKDEDQLEPATKKLAEFEADPGNARYQGVIEKADAIFREEEVKRRQYKKNVVDVSKNQRPAGRRRGPLTTLLLIACIVAFVFTDFGAGVREGVQDLPAYRALSFTAIEKPESFELEKEYGQDDLRFRLASIQKGEVWRLITPIFIHFGIMHIVFNMLWMVQLGTLIENRYGTFWFAVLVLTSAALSNFAQCTVPVAIDGSAPRIVEGGILIGLAGGMSGVVYALFGFVWMKSVYDPTCGFRINEMTVFIMIGWLFLCMTGVMGSIGNWAHGVGLVVGMLAGYLPTVFKR